MHFDLSGAPKLCAGAPRIFSRKNQSCEWEKLVWSPRMGGYKIYKLKLESRDENGNQGQHDTWKHEAGQFAAPTLSILLPTANDYYFWTTRWSNVLYCCPLWLSVRLTVLCGVLGFYDWTMTRMSTFSSLAVWKSDHRWWAKALKSGSYR